MNQSIHQIPREDLVQFNVSVHPGYKRLIQIRARERDMTVSEYVHTILEYVLGDPGPVHAPRSPLVPARSS